MRRTLPWALVSLLVLTTAAGAGLGIANQPTAPSAQDQVAQLIAITRSAGSARFIYSSGSTSSNPLLRTTEIGYGVVDFTTGSMSTSDRNRNNSSLSGTDGASPQPIRQTTVDNQIWISRTTFFQLPISAHVLGAVWIKGATFPANSLGPLGALGTISPVGTLETDETVPGLQIRTVGRESIGGVGTTKYELVVPTCRATSPRTSGRSSTGPTVLWVDDQDRLVQARSSTHLDVPAGTVGPGISTGRFAGRSTIVSTIRLSAYGTPVTITPPPVMPAGSSGSSSFLVSARNGCPA